MRGSRTPGTSLGAGQYLVVAEDVAMLTSKYETAALGPYEGRLSNDGEQLVLRDATGDKVDEVDYKLGFPWPTVGDEVPQGNPGSGRSMGSR